MRFAILALLLAGCATSPQRQLSGVQAGDKEEATINCTEDVLLSQGKILNRSVDINASMEQLLIGGRQYMQLVLVPRITKCMMAKGYRYSEKPDWHWDDYAAATALSEGSLNNFMANYSLHVSHP